MDLQAGQSIRIDPYEFFVSGSPTAPGTPYRQEGHTGIVYQVVSHMGDLAAVKVFKPQFRSQRLVRAADQIRQYAALPGLYACERTVLIAPSYARLLRELPDLAYAMVMPWLEGQTWREIQLSSKPLTPEQASDLAYTYLAILKEMEQRGLAHCDLAGSNIIVAISKTANKVENVHLVDLENMYVPGFYPPEGSAFGHSGYLHPSSQAGAWSPEADRFSGAILLAEMLAWSEAQVVQSSAGQQFFAAGELGQESARYQLLASALEGKYGGRVRELLDRVWYSSSLGDCPPFSEWAASLPGGGKNFQTLVLESQPAAPFILSKAAAEQGREFLVQPVNAPYRPPAPPQPQYQTMAGYQGQPQTAVAHAPSTYQVPYETAAIPQDFYAEPKPAKKNWLPWIAMVLVITGILVCLGGYLGYSVIAPLFTEPTATYTQTVEPATATPEPTLIATQPPTDLPLIIPTLPANTLPEPTEIVLPTFTPVPTDTEPPPPTPTPAPSTGTLRIRNNSGAPLWIGIDKGGGSIIQSGTYLEFYHQPMGATVNVKYCKVDRQGNVTNDCNYASFVINAALTQGSVR